MESLAPEVALFGIHTMVVEPGFFRTDLLTPESTSYAALRCPELLGLEIH
jgi:NAD(P)-dependent dehydrogenase (short-subunit alcohol dehydrogenase family)